MNFSDLYVLTLACARISGYVAAYGASLLPDLSRIVHIRTGIYLIPLLWCYGVRIIVLLLINSA
jgi:hypothetical protein